MRNLLLLLSVLISSLNGLAQNNRNHNLYIQAFKNYFIPNTVNKSEVLTGKMEFRNEDNTLSIDTVIVQKEDYLPAMWPYSIIYYTTVNYHIVKYLSKNEIDNFGGKHVSLLKISPVSQDGDIYLIKMISFTRVDRIWTTYGYRQFKFIYDPDLQKYKLIQPVITIVNG